MLLEAGNRASGFPEAGMGATWEAAAGTKVLLLQLQFKGHKGTRIPRGWKGGSIGVIFWICSVLLLHLEAGNRASGFPEAGIGGSKKGCSWH